MGVWNTLCRFAERRVQARRRGAGTKRPRNPKIARPRGLRVEQFEDRVLLSINTSTPDASALWSQTLQQSVQRAADLTQYTTAQLTATTKWVVGLAEGTSSAQVANAIGADSLAAAPVLSNTYIWQFPTSVGYQDAANRLKTAQGVTYSYPLVTLNNDLRFIPNDTYFAYSAANQWYQWNLQNTGQNGGTVGADADVVPAWDTVKGQGVVIGIVDVRGGAYPSRPGQQLRCRG